MILKIGVSLLISRLDVIIVIHQSSTFVCSVDLWCCLHRNLLRRCRSMVCCRVGSVANFWQSQILVGERFYITATDLHVSFTLTCTLTLPHVCPSIAAYLCRWIGFHLDLTVSDRIMSFQDILHITIMLSKHGQCRSLGGIQSVSYPQNIQW